MKLRHLPLLLFCLLALMTTALPGYAQNRPSVHSVSHRFVGANVAHVLMEYDDYSQNTNLWFEVSTSPTLAGAGVAGQHHESPDPTRSGRFGAGYAIHAATLSGLAPGTTYYYRANATNRWGWSQSGIQSFTTASMTAPRAPWVRFERFWMDGAQPNATFLCNGHGFPATCYGLWSLHPDMSGAQQGTSTGTNDPVGTAMHMAIPTGNLADQTTVYVQGIIQSAGGEVRTGITPYLVRKGGQ